MAALNAQTAVQFQQYAAQQYPNSPEQQLGLIRQLQEQHYQQYMQQLYQVQLAQQQVKCKRHTLQVSTSIFGLKSFDSFCVFLLVPGSLAEAAGWPDGAEHTGILQLQQRRTHPCLSSWTAVCSYATCWRRTPHSQWRPVRLILGELGPGAGTRASRRGLRERSITRLVAMDEINTTNQSLQVFTPCRINQGAQG